MAKNSAILSVCLLFILVTIFSAYLPSKSIEYAENDQPVLRLNMQNHTAQIPRAGMPDSGDFFVTASRDNTIKVWRTKDLSLIKTIRPPVTKDFVENSSSAFLWAIDISPDGKYIAAAGQIDNDGNWRASVFDRLTGDMIATLFLEKAWVADIAFSKDGTLLALGAYGDNNPSANGLWVWDTEEWNAKPIYRDPVYGIESDNGGRPNGLAFNVEGVLVTTSYDGYLRRYQDVRANTPPTFYQAPDGLLPYDIEYSPDGKKVLVGYLADYYGTQKAALKIHNSDDLNDFQSLNIEMMPKDEGGFASANRVRGVGWSRSQRFVYANVSNAVDGPVSGLRRWDLAEGNGDIFHDYEVCTDQNILEVLPYQSHGAVFLNGDPCLSLIDDAGSLVDQVGGDRFLISQFPLRDDTERRNDFLVSDDGSVVVAKNTYSRDSYAFDINRMRLFKNPNSENLRNATLKPYAERNENLVVADWAATTSPKVNGIELDILDRAGRTDNESWSVDVAETGDYFVLGTRWFVARYGADGQLDWSVPTTELPLRVNISADGNTVVVAYRDGVVRWHDARPDGNGQVLLSLFVHSDLERWIVWTPEGYYESYGGETFIGWHRNFGSNRAARFWDVSEYRAEFAKPEIVRAQARRLTGNEQTDGERNIDASLLQGGADTSSIVTSKATPFTMLASQSVSIEADRAQLNLGFRFQSPSGKPIEEFRIIVDSRTEYEQHSPVPEDELVDVSVPIFEGDRIGIIQARSEDGWGPSAFVDIEHVLAASAAVSEDGTRGAVSLVDTRLPKRNRPNLRALVVGVDTYQEDQNIIERIFGGSSISNLCCATNDAQRFAEILNSQENTDLIGDVDVELLLNENATLDNIRTGLSNLQRATKDELIVIFLAGHGQSDEFNEFYFIPYGVDWSNYYENETLSGSRISAAIERSAAKSYLFLDTCHAASVLQRKFYNEIYMMDKETYAYAASRDGQPAYEQSNDGHGAFTLSIIEAVEGRSPGVIRDNRIYSRDLGSHIEDRVLEITDGKQEAIHIGWKGRRFAPNTPLFYVEE